MYVFRTVAALQGYLQDQRPSSVGFVPTMGALHEGHLSLLQQARAETDVTVVSIFVNPTQFNDPGDLEKYPRNVGADLDLLYPAACDVVFVPSVAEIYPPGEDEAPIALDGLDTMMEGKFRPGHFAGVVQVVRRLLEIIQPDQLFMGQKDFQQVAVCRHLIEVLNFPVELVMCPTVREADGLAMSSRNVRLTSLHRSQAPIIYQTLTYAREHLGEQTIAELERVCLDRLDLPGFRPEYFSIVDGKTLLPATAHTVYIVACCAVWAGDVRLIDNMELRKG